MSLVTVHGSHTMYYSATAAFVNETPPATAKVGTPYSYQFASTGEAPITYAKGTGTIPTGLTLSASGLLSGTPTTVTGSPFTFNVIATGAVGSDTTPNITITVAP